MPSTMTPSENQMDYDSSGAGSFYCQCLKHLGARITPLLFFIQWLNTTSSYFPDLLSNFFGPAALTQLADQDATYQWTCIWSISTALENLPLNLEANVVLSAILRIGKCFGPLTSLCDAFSKASNVNPHSSAHSEAKFHDDLEKIVTELMKNEVFSYFPNRKHTSLPNFHGSLLDKINSEQMNDYIKKHSIILV